MFTDEQKQMILEIVEQTAMGLFTRNEMVDKLETIAKEADPTSKFEVDEELMDQISGVINSTSTMARRPE